MELGVLGPLEARADDGHAVELGPRKQRLLLLALLVRPGTPRSTEQLIDDVWGDDPPGDPRSSLRAYLSNLRKILEPHRAAGSKPTMLVRRGNGYVLSVDAATIDAIAFEREVADARALGCGDESVSLLVQALGRWRGNAFADAAYDDFAAAEAARLSGLRDETTERLADWLVQLGRSVEAITVLDEWIARSPYDEGARRRLATAQYAAGRQADALRTLADTRRMMLDELGLDPSPEVVGLERRILEQDPSLLDGVAAAPALGSATPVPVGAAPSAPVAPSVGPPGRADEFATMRSALERVATAGAGETLLLSADAGIGKTRLAEELVGPAASTGTTVVWSRCDDGASNLALWPWASGLRDLIDGRDPDEVEALLGADRAALASFVPGLTDTAPLARDDPSQRYQAFDSTMRVLRRLAEAAPVIWVIEDLHWADAASREMAVFIARRLADVPLLLVVTARDHDLDHPTIAELIQLPMTTHLALGPLDRDGVVELVRSSLTDLDADLLRSIGRALHDRTGGNPFFALQLLEAVDPADPLRSITDANVPGGLASAVLARLTTLPVGATDLLTVASAARSEWTLEVSAPVAGLDLDTAIDVVEAAEGAGLVEEVPDVVGAYRFAHALVGESLYGRLSSMRRTRLHARLGAAVEERRADDDDPVNVIGLARHYCLGAPAGTGLDGARWAIRAARQCVRRHDSESGLEHVRNGLAAIDHVRPSPGDDADRRTMLEIELWCERSECERRLDRPSVVTDDGSSLAVAAQSSAEKAFSLASRVGAEGSVDAMARAALTYCGDGDIGPWLGYWFDDPTGERMIDAVLAHPAAGELDEATRIRLLNRLADVDHDGRPGGRGDSCTTDALDRARRLGDTRLVVESLYMRHVAAHFGLSAGERGASISEMLELSKGAGLVRHEVLARRLLLGHAIESLDRHGEDEQLAEIAALGDRSGDDGVAFTATWVPVSISIFRGDLDAAAAGLTDAATRFAHFEEAMLDSLNLQLAQLLREQHQMIAIESVLRDRLAVQSSPAWRAPLAVALAEHDRRTEAQELLDSMPDSDFTEISEGPLQFLTPSLMADAVAHLGDVGRAEQLLGFLEPYADRLVNFSAGIHYHGWLGYHVGRLCRVVGRHEDARRYLDDALDRCVRSEARPAELRCRLALAELAVVEGEPVTDLAEVIAADAAAGGLINLGEQARRLVSANR